MNTKYPHIIENNLGEKLIFKVLIHEKDGDKVIAENFIGPGSGPVMHTHFKQDEALTVVSGEMTYQVLGEVPKIASPGDTVVFKSGTPHKFWNSGSSILNCTGWIKPANSIVYYLDAIYSAQKKSGKDQPEIFDAAYLLTRYKNEYDLPEMPFFIKKVIMPIVYLTGRITGKYGHFKDAPKPL